MTRPWEWERDKHAAKTGHDFRPLLLHTSHLATKTSQKRNLDKDICRAIFPQNSPKGYIIQGDIFRGRHGVKTKEIHQGGVFSHECWSRNSPCNSRGYFRNPEAENGGGNPNPKTISFITPFLSQDNLKSLGKPTGRLKPWKSKKLLLYF